jgi:exopolyphosphatase/guanosine-5'-triphosphate,3'-diphosphate pyrophosphatase
MSSYQAGQDAFTVGEISAENIDRMCDAMTVSNLLMATAQDYRAFATSAMREAHKAREVIDSRKGKY